MGTCCHCNKKLLTGYLLCRKCKDSVKLPLQKFIDELAMEIILEHLHSCEFCGHDRPCDAQEIGHTCFLGVRAYLMERADAFAEKFSQGVA